MNKKTILGTVGVLCLVSCVAMYMIGKNNDHLSELKNYWWMPLPLAAILLSLAARTK